jgi:hypothetical protein
VDHSVAGPQPYDLVLQLEFTSLEFRNLEVVGGRMGDRVLDFTLERLVSPFKLAQMHLQRHVPVPPIAVPTAGQCATGDLESRSQNALLRREMHRRIAAPLAPRERPEHTPRLVGIPHEAARDGAAMALDLSEAEIAEFEAELARLKEEHRDLDGAIEALESMVAGDQLQIQRLKKRKLILKDRISYLEDQITPDIIA